MKIKFIFLFLFAYCGSSVRVSIEEYALYRKMIIPYEKIWSKLDNELSYFKKEELSTDRKLIHLKRYLFPKLLSLKENINFEYLPVNIKNINGFFILALTKRVDYCNNMVIYYLILNNEKSSIASANKYLLIAEKDLKLSNGYFAKYQKYLDRVKY